MDATPERKISLAPVFVGILLLIFLALGIGFLLPDAVRGYDVEKLAIPAMETRIERDQKDLTAEEKGLDRKADYVTWKAFGYTAVAILDLGDLRIAVPRIPIRGAKTWMGRLKIRTSASPGEVEEEEPYKVSGKRLWLESRWKDGVNQVQFCGLPFELRDGRLHIAGQDFEFGKGRRILVINLQRTFEAGLRVLDDGSLQQLPAPPSAR